MAVVNFNIPTKLNQQVLKTVREKGFASKAEFFRFAALSALGSITPARPLDQVIAEARADYDAGNYQSARSARGLLRKLKK